MVRIIFRLSASALALCLAHSIALAGDVTFVAQENNVNSFRTTTVLKANDPDGDNVYGTTGYVLFATDNPPGSHGSTFGPSNPLTFNNGQFAILSSLPAFLTLESNGYDTVAGGFAYPIVDNPTAAPGSVVSDVEAGLGVNNDIPIGTEASVVDIVIQAGFPTNGVRVGVLGAGSGEDAMGVFRLTQTAGPGAGSASTVRVGTPETLLQFFDIINALPGDRYTLFLIKTPGSEHCAHGVDVRCYQFWRE